MSDLENKLRSLAFRALPQDLRRHVLAAAESTPARWTWRDWMWPSPLAWAGLAALWIVCLATQDSTPATRPMTVGETPVTHYALNAQFDREPGIDALIFTP